MVPRAFGKFFDEDKREAVIPDRVCETCNNSFSKFEMRHARESLDAFQRSQAKVKGRHSKRKKKQKDKGGPNPYLQGRNGKRAITIEGWHPDGYRVLMRDDPEEGAVELTSAQFEHPKTKELIAIDLTPELTKENLRKQLTQAGYENGSQLRCFWRPHEQEWVMNILKDENPKINEPPPPYGFRARIEGGLRNEDFRSIAKTALNYMIRFNALGLTGHETSFAAVKRFIREGIGSVGFFCAVMKPRLPPDGFEKRCHLLKLDISEQNGVVAWIQLFASKDMACVVHRIFLGAYPFSIHVPNQSFGHCFRITPGNTDLGEIIPLAQDTIFPRESQS